MTPTPTPTSILITSNDRFVPTSKTSEMLASACRRLGLPVMVRDCSDGRYLGAVLEQFNDPTYTSDAAVTLRHKYHGLLLAFEVDTILSLDLQWLFVPDLFTETPEIRAIHSLWFDDMRSWARANYMFSTCREQFQKHIRHPKVHHYFYGRGLAEEGRTLGMPTSQLSYLAAPYEFLSLNHPCEIRDRAAFIGNPGFREIPPEPILKAMHDGAEINELRQLNAEILMRSRFEKKERWLKEEPSIDRYLAVALQARVQFPYRSALEILRLAAEHYPRAAAYLDEHGEILDATLIVKLVNRCDRPAVILRLYQKGLVDVYSNPKEWEPYGVKALPSILIPQLPRYYQKYSVHLNAANALRDATANEKLFEIAACGRVSLNLASPDISLCYNAGEIALAANLAELEEQARHLLANPDQALAMGKRARAHTAREHLWDHRLKAIFNLSDKEGDTAPNLADAETAHPLPLRT
jgi:hypothetical protein